MAFAIIFVTFALWKHLKPDSYEGITLRNIGLSPRHARGLLLCGQDAFHRNAGTATSLPVSDPSPQVR